MMLVAQSLSGTVLYMLSITCIIHWVWAIEKLSDYGATYRQMVEPGHSQPCKPGLHFEAPGELMVPAAAVYTGRRQRFMPT